jgi:hypothetical protein
LGQCLVDKHRAEDGGDAQPRHDRKADGERQVGAEQAGDARSHCQLRLLAMRGSISV